MSDEKDAYEKGLRGENLRGFGQMFVATTPEEERAHEEGQRDKARLDEEERRVAAHRERERDAAEERHHATMEQLARDSEAAEEHREVMQSLERARADAERERLEAETEWREAQEREKQEERRRLELRHGLPSFSDEFQAEWLGVNEALVDVLEREREFAEALEAARRSDLANRRVLTVSLDGLVEHLAEAPPDELIIVPPAQMGPGWTALQKAFADLVEESQSNPYVRMPPISETWMGRNLFRLWLLVRGMSGLRSSPVAHFQFSLSDQRARPGGIAIGCAVLLVGIAPIVLTAAIGSLTAVMIDVSLVYFLAAALCLVPVALVAVRISIAPKRRRAIIARVCRFYDAASAVARKLDGEQFRQAEVRPLTPEALEESNDPTTLIQPAFASLERKLRVAVAFKSGTSIYDNPWLAGISPKLGPNGKPLADAAIRALRTMTESAARLRETEGREPSAADQRVKASFQFMEAEIRKLGRQVIDGVRLGTSRLELIRCPACAGPVTQNTRECPYCRSALVTQKS